VAWLSLVLLISGWGGMVLCIGADGHMAVEMAHDGHCHDTATEHNDAHALTLAAAADDCCEACVDVALSSKAVLQKTTSVKAGGLLRNNLLRTMAAAWPVTGSSDTLASRCLLSRGVALPVAVAFRPRTLVLRI